MAVFRNGVAMIETLVLATDGSESVRRATAMALDLAERFDASIHVLYVVDEDEVDAAPAGVQDELRTGLEERGDTAFSEIVAATDHAVETIVKTGRPASEIVQYAEEQGADVVAIGTRGRHGEHRLLLGSVAEEVVRRCEVPVLTVRQLTNGSGPT